SGNFALLFKTPSGPAISVPQGTQKLVFCLGGNLVVRADVADIGMVQDFAGASAPAGWLECDGSAVSRAGHPELFARLGTIWGAGDGSATFNLPNMTDSGRYRRSRGNGTVVGTYQANQLVAHSHAASTVDNGSSIAAAGSHNHGGTTGAAGNHNHGGAPARPPARLSRGTPRNRPNIGPNTA